METTLKQIYKKFSDSILLPHLIQLDTNLIMASFQLMKLMPAKFVIEKALREGRLNPKYPIIETSSGTYALGIGIICGELGIPFHIISDPAIDDNLQRRLESLGGYVQILPQILTGDNPQIYRLNALNEALLTNEKSYWPSQYDNPENQDAYAIFAQQLLDHIGHEFTLVGTVGSGGSTSGTIKFLRQQNNSIHLIGVDTFGSVLFGLPNGKRTLRGLGNSLMPGNINHQAYDQVHWVSAHDAFANTRFLHSKLSCFHGPTTGAAYQVAKWRAAQYKNETIVFIAPDTGHRYQSTVYNEEWLQMMNLINMPTTIMPHKVNTPNEVSSTWAYIDWNRRALTDFLPNNIEEIKL